MGAAEHLDDALDAADERLRLALADAAHHRFTSPALVEVLEAARAERPLAPMQDIDADPVVMYSPTGTVMVAFGELVLRFRTRTAFALALETIDRQCLPPRPDGLFEFDQLQVRSQVRVGGEWQWVDAIDHHDRKLLLRQADVSCAQPWWYEATDGEVFTCAEPF